MNIETEIKNQLIKILKTDFRIIESIEGKNFFDDKKVRPDLGLILNNELFLVEIKDDTAKNFTLAELLRQAITYRYSIYNCYKPKYVFIVTTNLINGISILDEGKNSKMLGLAYKLGIGIISLQNNELILKIGSQIIYKRNIENLETVFGKMPKLVIGTNAKSNHL